MFFGVLGGLVVRCANGDDLPVGGSLPRTLLAVLLLAEGRPTSADALMDAMWDGAPPDSATGTLHSTVSRLRRTLSGDGRTALRLEPSGYVLDVDPEDVDARRFERLAREGRSVLSSDPRRALTLLEQAEALWRGPALSDFADRDFARSAAVRLEQLRLDTLEDRVEAQLATGGGPDLLATLPALAAAHPLRERLCGQHAVTLYRCGRQAEALAAIASTRTLLREELGLDLSPALAHLEGRLLRHDPSLMTPAGESSAPAAAAAAAFRSGIVGRDGEIALLRALLREVASGAVRFGLLEGEPGIGKTRLLEEAAALAGAQGMRVVWGRCADSEVVPAYWPWLEALRALDADGALGQVPPMLAALLDPAAAGEQQAADSLPFRLFEVVAAALVTAARRQSLVVLLEDLHWADAASAELLNHLSVRLHDVPVAVLATSRELDIGREDPVTAAVAAVTRRAGTRRLLLRPVPASASAALVRQAVGVDVGTDAAAAIHRRAQGNAFFIGELSRLLRDADQLGDPAAVTAAQVPSGVRDVVRRRLVVLPQGTRSLLEVAAVVGREADLAVLAHATGRTLDDCIDAVEAALSSRILVPVEGAPGRLQFAHALVRDAALTEVTALRLARLHAKVAEAVLTVRGDGDDTAEVVAPHLWAAAAVVGPATAAQALERAADVALRRIAYEAADGLLTRALALRRQAGSSLEAQEAELLTTVRLVSLRRGWKGYSHAYETVPLDRAEELALRTGRADLYLGLLFAHWGAAATSGDVPSAERLGRRIRRHAIGSDDPVVELLGESVWAITCWHLGRMTEADECMRAVQEQLSTLPPQDLARMGEVDSAASIYGFAVHIPALAGTLDPEGRFEELAEQFSRPYDRLVLGNFAAMTAVLRGDDATAGRWAGWALEQDRDGLFDFFGGACQTYLGWARARQGEPQAGLDLIEQGLERYLRTGSRTGFGFFAANRAEAMLLAGRPLSEVTAWLDDADRSVKEQGERFVLPYLAVARARVALCSGDLRAAGGHLAAARAMAEEMGIAAVAQLAATMPDLSPTP